MQFDTSCSLYHDVRLVLLKTHLGLNYLSYQMAVYVRYFLAQVSAGE